MRVRPLLSVSLVTLGILLFSQAASARPIFYTDFGSGVPAQFSGAGSRVSTQGYATAAPAFLNYYLWNGAWDDSQPTVLTVTGLPAHTSVDVSFLWAVLDSWDGQDTRWGPDWLAVNIGGYAYSWSFGDWGCGEAVPGLTEVACSDDGSLAGNWRDDAAYLAVFNSFPHTSSSLTISWYAYGDGYQGGDDESWAIDNVSVTLGGTDGEIPEPASLALLGSGLLVLLALRRRRR